tara:strand:- start:1289 stop:2116 length:828 start_codon:yes stop_codon:yes gene_type:complete
MQFRRGYTVKPKKTLRSGQVIFTDGTTDVFPNQRDCEAYGYTYNEITRTCEAFHYSTTTGEAIRNESNLIKGNRNNTEKGSRNTFIVGENNTSKGLSNNSIIVGDTNEIANGVDNAAIFGNYGLAQRDGETVFGGGAFNGAGIGKGQSSIISLSGTTTDGTRTNLKVNDSSTNTIIARASTSSFQGFEAYVIGVRTAGSHGGGAVNDRAFIKVSGIAHLTSVDQTTTTVGKFGTVTGWSAEVAFTGTNDMHIAVLGHADMAISWSATLHLYEMIV